MTMHCPNCNKLLGDDSEWCPVCGAHLIEDEPSDAPIEKATEDVSEEAPTEAASDEELTSAETDVETTDEPISEDISEDVSDTTEDEVPEVSSDDTDAAFDEAAAELVTLADQVLEEGRTNVEAEATDEESNVDTTVEDEAPTTESTDEPADDTAVEDGPDAPAASDDELTSESIQPTKRRTNPTVIASIVALCALIVVSVVLASTKNKLDTPAVDNTAVTQTDAGTDYTEPADTTEPAEAKPEVIIPEDAVTEVDGLPTAYTFTQLDGASILKVIKDAGFVFDHSQFCFVNPDTSALILVADKDGLLSEDAIANLKAGSPDKGLLYVLTTNTCTSASDIFDKLVESSLTVEDKTVFDDAGFAVAYGPSESKYLIEVTHQEGESTLFIFNDTGLETGLLDNLVGYEVGASAEEVYENVTTGALIQQNDEAADAETTAE